MGGELFHFLGGDDVAYVRNAFVEVLPGESENFRAQQIDKGRIAFFVKFKDRLRQEVGKFAESLFADPESCFRSLLFVNLLLQGSIGLHKLQRSLGDHLLKFGI